MDVSVDDNPRVFAVHWNVPDADAFRQFEAWGFRGIKGFEKIAILNGNKARDTARANAIRQGCDYFWVGSYDVGTGTDSAIYAFEYELYDGDGGRLFDGRKQ